MLDTKTRILILGDFLRSERPRCLRPPSASGSKTGRQSSSRAKGSQYHSSWKTKWPEEFRMGKCLLTKKRFCGREVWNVSPKSTAPYKVVTFLNCPKSPLLYHGLISWTWLMRVRKIYIPMPERKHSININFSLLIAEIFCHQPYHDQGFPKSKKMNKASNGRLCSCVMSWCQKFKQEIAQKLSLHSHISESEIMGQL